MFIATGKLPAHLSVQELVAYEKQDDGCDGGDGDNDGGDDGIMMTLIYMLAFEFGPLSTC